MPRLATKSWTPGVIITNLVFTSMWGYLVYTGNISNIWPALRHEQPAAGLLRPYRLHQHAAAHEQGQVLPHDGHSGVFMTAVTFWAGYLQLTTDYIPTASIFWPAWPAFCHGAYGLCYRGHAPPLD